LTTDFINDDSTKGLCSEVEHRLSLLLFFCGYTGTYIQHRENSNSISTVRLLQFDPDLALGDGTPRHDLCSTRALYVPRFPNSWEHDSQCRKPGGQEAAVHVGSHPHPHPKRSHWHDGRLHRASLPRRSWLSCCARSRPAGQGRRNERNAAQHETWLQPSGRCTGPRPCQGRSPLPYKNCVELHG
jgi:hypothetical protein